MASDQARIEALIASLEPSIRRAFLDAIADIRSEAQIGVIVQHLEAGDIDLAVQALNIRPEFFGGIQTAIGTAFASSAQEALNALPAVKGPVGGRAVMRFDGTNDRAVRWVRDHSSAFIDEIVADQGDAIRGVLTDAMERGINPRTAALDVVGRVNKSTGRREGGLIGLHSQQIAWVENAHSELSDPARVAEFLSRTKRDRRLDPIINRAIKEGRALTKDEQERVLARYTDRLLKYRGDLIARTEARTAQNEGQYEALRQQVDNGLLRQSDIQFVWLATTDARTRDTHAALNGASVKMGEPFQSPSGALMRFPMDSSLGAPADEIINCRCTTVPRIDRFARFQRAAS